MKSGFFLRETGSEQRSSEFPASVCATEPQPNLALEGLREPKTSKGKQGRRRREKMHVLGRQLDRGGNDVIVTWPHRHDTLGGRLISLSPQAGKIYTKIGFFLRETGSEQRSTDFSGLRMRDGETE